MVRVVWMLSTSRISPTSTTSGSSRRAARRPRANEVVSTPTSRWLTADCLWLCTYSIGSSRVRMCRFRRWLIQSSIEAWVVDLPEPVGPVNSTKPWDWLQNHSSTGGSPSSSKLGM
jgi:hypothetical protein